jgi:hypothetical protein
MAIGSACAVVPTTVAMPTPWLPRKRNSQPDSSRIVSDYLAEHAATLVRSGLRLVPPNPKKK